jgi:hypothetical protein
MTNPIDNTDDVIDSRDIIARIEDLRQCKQDHEDDPDGGHWSDEEADELAALENLAEQAEGYGDWEHGEALIHRGHWAAYAQQLAEDIGAVNRDASWPNNHIDWEAAAEELEVDYMSVDFDGQEYLMRA